MTRSRSPKGVPTAEVADYYGRRAASVGLIITEGTAIARPGALDDPYVPHFHGEAALQGWAEVVKKVHAHGGVIMPQLWHVGAYIGPGSRWAENDDRIESPSGLLGAGKPFGRAMTDADIADTISAYASAARSAVTLGFDGVEIHGAHGYLIDQFLWSVTNRRGGRYGGESVVDRARFAIEVVQAVRQAVGPDFPVSLRLSQFKQQDYKAVLAADPGELAQLLEPLALAGVSIFHLSQRRFWEPAFEQSSLNLAGWAKKITGKPTITVGSVGLQGEFMSNWKHNLASEPTSLDKVIDALDSDSFDLVAVGRALLSDPDWAEKMASGRISELQPFDMNRLKILY